MLMATRDNGDLAKMNSLVKGPPLTRQEVLLLIDLIQVHSIVMSKQTNACCNRLKEKAWQLISEDFNAKITSCPRRPYQLKLKWDNLKKSARRKAAAKNQPEGYYIPTDDVLDTVLQMLEGTSESGDSTSSSNNEERSQASTKSYDAMEGKHGANLLRHFHHKHKEEYKDVVTRNKERNLLLQAAYSKTSRSAADLKEVLKGIAESTLAVTSQTKDDAMETLLVSDNENNASEVQGNADEEEVEASRVPPAASDPLHTLSDHSSMGSDSDSDCFQVPIIEEVMKQRSRVRRRPRSDVVRKNIAIAEYYEAKKMKVHLEIKKLQMEIDMRTNNRSAEINVNSSNSYATRNMKTESI